MNQDETLKKEFENTGIEFDVFLLFRIIKRNWLWIFLLFCLTSSIGYVYLRYKAPDYDSSLVLQVLSENKAQKLLEVDALNEDKDLAEDVELLRSKMLFSRALKNLPLEVAYYNKGRLLDYELYKESPIRVNYKLLDSTYTSTHTFFINFKNVSAFELIQDEKVLGEYQTGQTIKLEKLHIKVDVVNESGVMDYINNTQKSSLYFKISNWKQLVDDYIKRLLVYPINEQANTIRIVFNDKNRAKTKDVVNALANEFIAYDVEERSKSSKKILTFVDTQLTKYYNKVKGSENKIQSLKKKYKLTNVESSSGMYLESVNVLENDLVDLDLKLRILDEIQKSIAAGAKTDVSKLLPLLSGTDYGSGVSVLIQQLQDLILQKQNLLYEVTENSEMSKSLDHKIETQKSFLLEHIYSIRKKAKIQRDGLLVKMRQKEKQFFNVPLQQLEYARLQKVLSIDEKFFTLLMEKRTEYSISEAGYVSQHRILHAASVPKFPINPNRNMVLLSCVLAGIVLSIIFISILYLFKNTISSIDEIEAYAKTSISSLGIIPKYQNHLPVSQLIIDKNPKSVITESFRVIRSNLQFLSSESSCKIMAITSTISGEGKTFTAINLAGILAYSGKKVLILDSDLRKPKLNRGFGVDNVKGVSTILINKNTIDECIHKSELENLEFITSGPTPPNPAELIMSGAMTDMLEELKKRYDYIVFDTPPIGLVADAMPILKLAHYPIYVFRYEYSKRYFIRNLDKLVTANQIKHLSIVLNDVEMVKRRSGYGGYGYGYGYGYTEQSGYFEEKKD